jgi:hypothetical protein
MTCRISRLPVRYTWAARKFTYWFHRSEAPAFIMHDKHTLRRVRSAYWRGNRGRLRKLLNTSLHKLYYSRNITRIIKPLWHVAHRGKNEKFVQNGRWIPQREKTLGQPKSTFTVDNDTNSRHRNGAGRQAWAVFTSLSIWTRDGFL